MTIRVRTSAIAALLFLASAPLALAQRGGGMRAGDSFNERKVAAWRGDAQIAGKILDEAGKGIPDAKVTFIFAARCSTNRTEVISLRWTGTFSAVVMAKGRNSSGSGPISTV